MSNFVKLRNITSKIGSGATPRGGNNAYSDQGVAFIRSQNVHDMRFSSNGLVFINDKQAERLNGVKVEKDDVLLNITGDSIARSCVVPSPILPARVNQHVSIIRCKDRESSPYVNYYLQYIKAHLLQICRVGGTRNALTKEAVGNLNINLFPDHKARANFLSALDAKIECNNRINAELEAIAKTLYGYWFVQFDFPGRNGKPYKSSGGKTVYNPTLKRKIPEGWSVKQLGNVAETSLGGTPSTKNKEYWENADIAWLSSAETAGFPVIRSEQCITPNGIKNSTAVLLPQGSVVVSIVRYIRPSILGIDAATNQSVVGILENKKLKKSFIYPFMCGEVPRLIGLRTGAQQPHINKGTIDETLMVIPTDDILEYYYKTAEPIYAGIITRAFETLKLTQLRDWLLPMLMNGQVMVA
jgi:type I restriction enzyme, S subunit